ncbi:aldehyde dehydrogenase family protein [Streptomyces sp. NBC_01363]|uniref:aldehyde dehydrogenase family protein n=1 Tax=Streptomyces sp. NBC_01363 TaxID=2903840 RepID=UPI00225A429E|nr:aldehyde dehydrogenase family protein [Streptomyces sp. NBC_01363]MCX4736953.1 aldehyde dehydrogenase family protein [Streptomyces sp. NBC_01363]
MNTRDEWTRFASTLTPPSAMWLDGAWSESAEGAGQDVVSPHTGKAVASVSMATPAVVDRAVAGARAAFRNGRWSRIDARDRGAVLRRWADLIRKHRDELAVLITLEMGKPVIQARDVELRATEATFRWYGELADKLLDEAPRGLADAVALVTREPVGVVAAITPYNFPLTLSSWKIAPALLAGNSIVVKPATQSPLSLLRLAELGSVAGLPDGVLQVVTGAGGSTGSALARHMDVDCLTFTGSPEVGKRLLTYSGESNAKAVHLELGGKSPQLVFADAPDLAEAARTVAWAITFNAGQMCTAGSRLLVEESIAERFVADVIVEIEAIPVGDPFDPSTRIGPVASAQHRADILAHARSAVAQGATLALGSLETRADDSSYLDPIVFTDVRPEHDLFRQEVFGPVLAVTSFTDADEAIELANDSSFGLGAGLWTSNLSRGHRLSRDIDVGLVWVNCYEEGDLSVPFGGRKLSGHSVDKSIHALDKFTSMKTTWIRL